MLTTVTLNEAEVKLLQELLQGDSCRLILEIAHTDSRTMREGLRTREEALKGIITKLEAKA